MELKVKIPKDFTPTEPVLLREQDERTVQYWVYTDEYKGKKYRDATGEEVHTWVKQLFDNVPIEDGSKLGLMVTKAAMLDFCLSAAVFQYRNLFGGPEFWESLENWQRPSKLAKKKKEK